MFVFGLLATFGFLYAAYKYGSIPAPAAEVVAPPAAPEPVAVIPPHPRHKPKYHRK